ncbi:MAG: H-X9-DG-CTERM domain-containing protein [Planctomycetota bacterium]
MYKFQNNEDGINDSLGAIISGLGPYNMAQPKIHRGGCNVALFDGHVEWIRYEEFWDAAGNYPTHQYWYNGNQPAPVTASVGSP